jgi:hypothetical protein
MPSWSCDVYARVDVEPGSAAWPRWQELGLSVHSIAVGCEANLRRAAPADLQVRRTDRKHGILVEATFTLEAESALAARESASGLVRAALIGAIRELPEEVREIGWWLGARATVEDLLALSSE